MSNITTTESERFTTEVYPVAERYARQVLKTNDELVSIALVLCWFYWSRRKEDYSPSHWAQIAVRQAASGRDLPRIGRTRAKDALSHSISGCGMDEVTERRPGPAKVIEDREQADLLFATLSDRERQMAEMLTAGIPAGNVARAFNVSPPRVTQIRRELMERLEAME